MNNKKITNKNLKVFVINLDDYITNYNNLLPYLNELGLKVKRFKGINALKNEHLDLKYRKYISSFSIHCTPKSVIGCALSHILCCKYIYNKYIKRNSKDCINNYYLILEDDAYPILKRKKFFKYLNNNINEINIIDKDWEIIQLHSECLLYEKRITYSTHYFHFSAAAYLISEAGIKKILNIKIKNHIDFIHHTFIYFNKYKLKKNLFLTDEESSLNRLNKFNTFNYYSLKFKNYIFELFNKYNNIILKNGEKTYIQLLQYKLIKFPFFKREYTANEIIDYILGLYILKKLIKYYKITFKILY
tara:strand:- start:14054 stop:14962 length:909 start_codon:yes stop_codon:yes gene_type:complete